MEHHISIYIRPISFGHPFTAFIIIDHSDKSSFAFVKSPKTAVNLEIDLSKLEDSPVRPTERIFGLYFKNVLTGEIDRDKL